MLSKEASSTNFWVSTCDWTQVFRAIGEHSNRHANNLLQIMLTSYDCVTIICDKKRKLLQNMG